MWHGLKTRVKSKIKWAALGGLVLSFASISVHFFLAKSSAGLVQYNAVTAFSEDLDFIDKLSRKGAGYRRLWGNVKTLEPLQPYANPRSTSYAVANERTMGSFMLKFMVILRRLELCSRFNSFSYLYDEEHFIESLASDVIIVKNLPSNLEESKQKLYPVFEPESFASPKFYLHDLLPKLKNAKVVGLVLKDGGCLKSILPSTLVEYQRRCRVAFQALCIRGEIVIIAHRMVKRLRGSGQPCLAYHPGLKRDTLAYHGCAELFQMINQGMLKELRVDSYIRKRNGSCPLMPKEVGLLLRALGYHPRTRLFLAGSETFSGERVLIPLHAMYANLVDRTSLCSKEELAHVFGPEILLPADSFEFPLTKSAKQLKAEWDRAGPRPRPLPPPLARPIYQHEKEGWHGWVAEKDSEADPSPSDLREQAHRLPWDAVDYIVSVEVDAFFPGFDNDGGWPDFASLVMGHRLYKMASSRTYRPGRKYLTELFNDTGDHLYHPPHSWTLKVREHLDKSTAEDGILRKFQQFKMKSYLSHPGLVCSCILESEDFINSKKGSNLQILFKGHAMCPQSLEIETAGSQESNNNDIETQEDETDMDMPESGEIQSDIIPSADEGEEMDPDD